MQDRQNEGPGVVARGISVTITERAGVEEDLHAAHNMGTTIVRDQAIRTAAWAARNAVTGPCVVEYDPTGGPNR